MLQTKETKFLIIFEAAKRSLLATEILFTKIKTELGTFEPSIDKSIDIGDAAAIPLIDSIAFIDFSHRFGTLVDSIPLIKKNSVQLKKLRNILKDVEKARNHLQHLRGDLSADKEIRYPILGALQWSTSEVGYILAFTQPIEFDIIGMSYDLVEENWENTLEYNILDLKINLGKVLKEMKLTYDYIVSQIEFSDADFSKLTWGATQSLGIKIIKNTNA